jgi:rubrerythrin
MAKAFSTTDSAHLQKLGDDKALALAAYGESVAAYRYNVLAEKSRDAELKKSFEQMAVEERAHRDRLQNILKRIASGSDGGSYFLSNDDKAAVCVGPRLVDARDETHFDEAMKLVIASEKRTSSFYRGYAIFAGDAELKALFEELAAEGLEHVQRLREIFKQAGKQIMEPCPVSLFKL